jgi:hypothetical protein
VHPQIINKILSDNRQQKLSSSNNRSCNSKGSKLSLLSSMPSLISAFLRPGLLVPSPAWPPLPLAAAHSWPEPNANYYVGTVFYDVFVRNVQEVVLARILAHPSFINFSDQLFCIGPTQNNAGSVHCLL